MAFTVPNAVNYTGPLNAVPLDWLSQPVEGPKGVQISIQWNAAQSGQNKTAYINLQDNAPLNFSKIRSMIVDNSANGSDIQFIFPDTETTVSIPAYTPYAIIPVFTNQKQFYVTSPNAQATDKTSFTVLNTPAPPVAVPTTQEQNFFNSSGINAQVSGSQQLIAVGVSGTLEAISIKGFAFGGGVNAMTATVSLVDGAGNTLMEVTVGTDKNSFANLQLFELSDLRLRFQNGLSLVWTTLGGPNSFFLTPNLYYRQP